MIYPNFQQSEHAKKKVPSWLKVDEVMKSIAKDKEKLNNVKTATNIKQTQEHIISYACNRCKKVHRVDSKLLQAQANLMEQKLQKEGEYRCPDCNNPLSPYETGVILPKLDNKYANQVEKRTNLQKEGGYNTYVDRIIVNKALDALTKHASKNGMTLAVVSYLKSEHVKNASDNKLDTLNNIECEIKWRYGRNQLGRVTATVGLDPAGKFEMPRVFKYANKEYPFEEKFVRSIESELRERDLSRQPKKSDWLHVRKPDPTRFRGATASLQNNPEGVRYYQGLNKEAYNPNPLQPMNDPNNQTQQFTPNQQVVNPMDGKTYNVVNQDPNAGITVQDPTTQQQMIVPKDQAQNLKPAVQTMASIANDLVNDELKKKPFSITATVDDIARDLLGEEHPLSDILDNDGTEEVLKSPTGEIGHNIAEEDPEMEIPISEVVDHLRADIDTDINHFKELNDVANDVPEPPQSTINEIANEELDEVKEDAQLLNQISNKNYTYNPQVNKMASRWHEIRKKIKEEKQIKTADLGKSPLGSSFQDRVVEKLTKQGYKGFKPTSNEKTESGRSENGVPVGESKKVEIGMTEYPDYTKPFQEAQKEMVENREHFQNEKKLPVYKMKREELGDYNAPDNFGLSETEREKEWENPKLQYESAKSIARDLVKQSFVTLAIEEDKKKVVDVPSEVKPPQVKPVVLKEQQKAPNLKEYVEPPVIDTAEGKVKEAITKLKMAQKEVADLQAEISQKIKPFQDSINEIMKKYTDPSDPKDPKSPSIQQKKLQAVFTYINMAFDQLKLLENSTVAYEQEIWAAVERSKAEAKDATLAEVLTKAQEIAPHLVEEIKKLKAAIENDRTSEVIERFLYKYNLSKSHEKKVRSNDEEIEIDSLLGNWTNIVKDLLNLNTLILG
ncbi:MAG: hypothetical protein M0R03_15670 [Novosphingobium sp.]|nr:hypothetical protein [Novosphingobium sp.]